jgi:hypothetical protein
MQTFPVPHTKTASVNNQRVGFHYYPDTFHYREADLATWLPALSSLGAAWLVLQADLGRAIPEHFLSGLKAAGIEPVLHFKPSLEESLDLREMRTLLEVYARWGVRHVIFFDRPNQRSSWPAAGWAQSDLVERFLDRFLPVAGLAVQTGLTPIFPPLQPGGSYWDTAFLRSALQAIERRRQETLMARLGLAAYGWSSGRSLDWGGGGPERWPESRPYLTPAGSQDQRGFRIFDWYLAIAEAVLHRPCPLFLLQAGSRADPALLTAPVSELTQPEPQDSVQDAYQADCLAIARLINAQPDEAGEVIDPLDPENPLEPVPPQVMAACFWLLAADPTSPQSAQAWFDNEGHPGVLAAAMREQQREQAARRRQPAGGKGVAGDVREGLPIRHYLLLPGFEWGVPDWYLEVIRPFVKKYRPTIGFSIDEASLAERVTVVGNSPHFTTEMMSRLESAGCQVEQIGGDGTSIATQLAER